MKTFQSTPHHPPANLFWYSRFIYSNFPARDSVLDSVTFLERKHGCCHTFWDILDALSRDRVIEYRKENASCVTQFLILRFHLWARICLLQTWRIRKQFIKSLQIRYPFRWKIASYHSFSALLGHAGGKIIYILVDYKRTWNLSMK